MSLDRFQLPAFEDPDESMQISLVKEAAARHGIRAKLRGDEIYQEGLNQPPKFLLNMEHYPKVIPVPAELPVQIEVTLIMKPMGLHIFFIRKDRKLYHEFQKTSAEI